jgi:hypothetical protein
VFAGAAVPLVGVAVVDDRSHVDLVEVLMIVLVVLIEVWMTVPERLIEGLMDSLEVCCACWKLQPARSS